MKSIPFILAKTLGKTWESAAKATLWGMLMTTPQSFRKQAERAGFKNDMTQGDVIFQALLDQPEGLWVGKADMDNPMAGIQTKSGKMEIHIPELANMAKDLCPESEADDLAGTTEFPLILNAGRHTKFTMNTLMRNPEWNHGKRDCTIAVNPEDAEEIGLMDGNQARVSTEAGSETGEIEISSQVRKGMVLIPHGFGLCYNGSETGINVNRLTKNNHRDPIGTPLHRFVPCRVETLK